MKHRWPCPPLLAAILSLYPALLSAQATPVSEVIETPSWLSPEGEPYDRYSPAALPLAKGGFAISFGGWAEVEQDVSDYYSAGRALLLDAQGEVGEIFEIDQGSGRLEWQPDPPSLAPVPDGGFLAVWSVRAYSSACPLLLRGYTAQLWTDDDIEIVPQTRCAYLPEITTNAVGRFAVAWAESSLVTSKVALELFDAPGHPQSHAAVESLANGQEIRGVHVGLDRSGRTVVLWSAGTSWQGQRFDRTGAARGPRLTFDMAKEGESFLAVTAAGSFLVAWDAFETFPGWKVKLQWFTAEGQREGSGLELPAVQESLMALGADSRGNFALLRRDGIDSLVLDLFNRDLIRQGPPVRIDTLPERVNFEGAIALSDRGSLLTVWNDGFDARVWQARHEADACVWRGGLFLCDTANDGDAAEKTISFTAGLAAATPFLADWNGDGRADPCVYSQGRFACDTAHDGGRAEAWSPTVGIAGDRPLLGDLDGDGKADPCVRRSAAILCDVARDGGSKDLRITFGTAADKVFLGDPDGDGRDDPCLLRDGRLLCDSAHDGGLAELRLDLRPLDARGSTLLGDVNGDGRDEACRFTGDRFVCGVYPPGGGVPIERIEIHFGQARDIPLLGDLDAF